MTIVRGGPSTYRRLHGALVPAFIAMLISFGPAAIADARDRSMNFSIQGPWSQYESKDLALCIDNHQSELEWASCHHVERMRFEGKMNNVYRHLLSHLSKEKASMLESDQRAWLKWRVRRCNEMPLNDDKNPVSFQLRFSECFLLLTEKRWYRLKGMAQK